MLRQFERVLASPSIDEGVWRLARALARESQRQGISVPATELLKRLRVTKES